MWKPQVQPRLVKAKAPISPFTRKGREVAAVTKCRGGEVLHGKEGRLSGAEIFRGGQLEATCREAGEYTAPTLSLCPAPISPPGRLPKSQRARKPDVLGLQASPGPHRRESGKLTRRWLHSSRGSLFSSFHSPVFQED